MENKPNVKPTYVQLGPMWVRARDILCVTDDGSRVRIVICDRSGSWNTETLSGDEGSRFRKDWRAYQSEFLPTWTNTSGPDAD